MPRPIIVLALVGLAVGCAGWIGERGDAGTAGPTELSTMDARSGEPAPRVLTPGASPAAYSMTVGETIAFVVPDPLAPDPEVSGTSVEVVDVANAGASGSREWELRALAPGRTTISTTASPPYLITIDVTPP